MKPFLSRAEVVELLYNELDSLEDLEVLKFCCDTMRRYLYEIYDFRTSEFDSNPYVVDEEYTSVNDDGDEEREVRLKLVDDPFSVGPDEHIYWFTKMKLCFKDKNISDRIYDNITVQELKNLTVTLLLEHPSTIFKGIFNPEVDILLNIICDVEEYHRGI